jgi:plastocyanin
LQKYVVLTVVFLIVAGVTAIPLRPLENIEEFVIVSSDELTFDVSEIDSEVGQKLELVLDNSESSGPHTLTIEEIPADGVEPESEDAAFAVHIEAEGGEEVSVAFTPTEPGRYRYFCAIPGHADAGMVGTLVVE